MYGSKTWKERHPQRQHKFTNAEALFGFHTRVEIFAQHAFHWKLRQEKNAHAHTSKQALTDVKMFGLLAWKKYITDIFPRENTFQRKWREKETWSKITYDSSFAPARRSKILAFTSYLLFVAYSFRYESHYSNNQSFQNVEQYSFHVQIRIIIMHILTLKVLFHIVDYKTYPYLVILAHSDSLLKFANQS